MGRVRVRAARVRAARTRAVAEGCTRLLSGHCVRARPELLALGRVDIRLAEGVVLVVGKVKPVADDLDLLDMSNQQANFE